MSCGSEDMTMRSSIFWGMNFAREDQRVALVRPFSTSVQRFPPRQQRRFGRGYEAGNYPNVVIRRSKNCLDSTIRSSGAGSNITGGFTARRSTRSNVNWTKSWSSGPKGNTKSYANISGGHDTGLLASRAGVQSCLLTGRWHVTRLHDGSCMSREAHVQFCERLGVRLPGATLPRGIPNQDAKLDLSLPVADDNTGSCACFQEMVGVRQPVQQSGWLPLQQQHFEASRRCTE